MTDFDIQPREYPHIRELILSRLPEFSRSRAYDRLSELERELPTVVAGSFARYLNDLMRTSGDEGEALRQLGVGLEVIERLALSSDPEVQNTLVVEVFEHLDLTDDEGGRFRRRLGPASKALHDRWIKS